MRVSGDCAINTLAPFYVAIDFSKFGEPFGFKVTLTQDGRSALYGPVRYTTKPIEPSTTASAEVGNDALQKALEEGMTLVASYWSGDKKEVRELLYLKSASCVQ